MRRGFNFVNFYRQNVYLSFAPNKFLFSSLGVYECEERKCNDSKRFTAKKNFFLNERKKYEDTFGDIESFELKFQRMKDDPDDVKEYQRDKDAQGKNIRQYINEIKAHLNNNDYDSAIKTLEVDMVNDRKGTVTFVYEILISYNAKIGNLIEAYRLYVNYKKRQGKMTGGMYTSLFNACANSKNSFVALEKANSLRKALMNDKDHNVNTVNYNAMLKAYGRHGDLKTALKIFDEVMERRDKVRVSSYAFMFSACLSDKNSGLRHALIMWRKMLQNRVKPDIYSFNLILRCARDCFLGEVTLINDLIEQIRLDSQLFYRRKVIRRTGFDGTKRYVLKIPADGNTLISSEKEESKNIFQAEENLLVNPSAVDVEENETSKTCDGNLLLRECESKEQIREVENSSLEKFDYREKYPNLLALNPSLSSVINFNVMTLPSDRFKLLGSVKGFLEVMSEFNVKPDEKTFTLMLDLLPSTVEAEQELISKADDYGLNLGTTFYNMLMRRRIFRKEEHLVPDTVKLMQMKEIQPDIVTFGVLATVSHTYESGMELIKNAHSFGIRLNSEILGALLKNAGRARDLVYVKALLEAAKEDSVQLCPRFITLLGKIVKAEKGYRQERKESEKVKELTST